MKRGSNMSPAARLLRLSEQRGACRVWIGATTNGYGSFHYERRTRLAHVVAWELVHGPLPGGIELDHFVCFNHACIAVHHLQPVSHKQNGENRKGAQVDSKTGVRGVSPFGAKYRATASQLGKQHHLGLFATIAEAEAAVVAKRLDLFSNSDLNRRAS